MPVSEFGCICTTPGIVIGKSLFEVESVAAVELVGILDALEDASVKHRPRIISGRMARHP
jgi:hypothetical protein